MFSLATGYTIFQPGPLPSYYSAPPPIINNYYIV